MWDEIELSRKVKVARRPPGEKELDQLQRQGVRAIVDLRTDEERFDQETRPAAEADGAKARDIRYIRVPVSTRHIDKRDLDRVGKALLDAPKPVLIHCASGKRAGMMALVHTSVEAGVPGEEMMEMAQHLDLVFGDPAQQHVFVSYVDQRETRPDPLARREEALRAEGRPIPLLPEDTRTLADEMHEDHHRHLAQDVEHDRKLDPLEIPTVPLNTPSAGTLASHVRIIPSSATAAPPPASPRMSRPLRSTTPARTTSVRTVSVARPPRSDRWSPPVKLGTAAALAGAILLALDRRLLVPILIAVAVMAGRAVASAPISPPGPPPPPADPKLDAEMAELERRIHKLEKAG